ncbi:hypothetical protein AR687_08100 [Flavobacteriaceae bacterium CRH]|nr:hypothetical protein AR687_08100 [Flavobacteriaceae bacterium CRH]
MKKLHLSKITIVLALTALLVSCKNNKQDGYSDEIETVQVHEDTTNSAKPASDSTAISGFSTTNKSTKGSSGTDEGGTGTGSGPGESPKDGATDSGPSEKPIKESKSSKGTTDKK